MKNIFVLLFISVFTLFQYSCKKPVDEPIVKEPTKTDIINGWIWDVMTDVYLWADEIDRSLFPTTETNSETFFYSLINENDRFSWIVDNYQELLNSFNNIELSSGISPYFIRISNSNDVIIVVEYVAPGSPADLAGVKRGDIITDINETTIDINNYIDLFYSENMTMKFADYVDQTLVPNGKEVTLTAVVIEQDPVIHHEIIDYEDTEIGYIVYTGFSTGENDKWVDSLDLIFADYKSKGISELIIDIRYNPGGRVSVATHIASVISPEDIPGNDNVFVKYQWNNDYQDYFLNKEGEDSENLVVKFEESVENNLNLSNIYFLTSNHSASASELIIIGLDPYMNVRQIGENTYGKFYGSITIPDLKKPPRHDWAVQPLVFKFANSVGYSDFNNGLDPDVVIEDNIMNAKQFGDITDPILAKALEEITGVSPIAKKSVSKPIPYEILPDPVRELKSRASIIREIGFFDIDK